MLEVGKIDEQLRSAFKNNNRGWGVFVDREHETRELPEECPDYRVLMDPTMNEQKDVYFFFKNMFCLFYFQDKQKWLIFVIEFKNLQKANLTDFFYKKINL